MFLELQTEKERGKHCLAWVLTFVFALVILSSPALLGQRGRAAWQPERLVAVGHTAGIKLFSEGILVVGLGEIETERGAAAPARACGLKVGDLILKADGAEIESTEHFQAVMAKSGGERVELTVRRGEKTLELTAAGVEDAAGEVRLGAWVRDSLAGIGTMTFYDPATGRFAMLGHGINDSDTNLLMPLESGAIMYSTVKAVKTGTAGEAGELRGDFDLQQDLGTLYDNTEQGVFGTMERCAIVEQGRELPVGKAEWVKTGAATILSNVRGDDVEEYMVEIEKICDRTGNCRNFLLRVTDERLLAATGGIVQGMSGSPIIQDGKLVGAVTHVLVNDPTRGYGIFIENMLEAAG